MTISGSGKEPEKRNDKQLRDEKRSLDEKEALRQEKRRIRKEILAGRAQLDAAARRRAEVLLTERILGHQWFYRARILLGFASYGTEISTEEILREALRLGKKVYLPRVVETADAAEMCFLRLQEMRELCPGYRGIPEPPDGAERYVFSESDAEQTLMLMPGVAFDGYGNRLGYGKGFYDRYLVQKEALRLKTIAVGFRCQLTEKRLPCGETDIRPYQVICV